MLDRLRDEGFDIMVSNHAEAILSVDFAPEVEALITALLQVSMEPAELIASGGGEAASTQRMRRDLTNSGWLKHNFRIETTVDGLPQGQGTSHEIDHIRRTSHGTLALEIEWNNKDPFFDRDLENFQRLHAKSVISVGIIVTRGASLQRALPQLIEQYLRDHNVSREDDLLSLGMKERTARQRKYVAGALARGDDFASAFSKSFAADKFGAATTHWSKLEGRIARGVGNPCPLLLIGLPAAIVLNSAPPDQSAGLFGGDT